MCLWWQWKPIFSVHPIIEHSNLSNFFSTQTSKVQKQSRQKNDYIHQLISPTSNPSQHLRLHVTSSSLSQISLLCIHCYNDIYSTNTNVCCECPWNVELVCIKLPCAGRQTSNSRGALDLYFSLSCDFLLSTVSKSGYLYLDIFLSNIFKSFQIGCRKEVLEDSFNL